MGLGFSYIFSAFLKDIVDDFGWSRAGFALGLSPMLLAYALASPIIGGLTDRRGARAVLTGATLVLGLSLACFGAMQSYWHYAATTFLFGFALTGLGDIPVGAVAVRWFDRGRGLALGVIYTGSNIGGAIVPIAATAIAAVSTWRTALFVLAAGGVMFLLPFAFLAVRGPRPGEVEPGPKAEAASADAPSLPLAAAMRTRSFWILVFALFVFYFYYLGVLQHLITFLRDRGSSEMAAAGLFSVAVAMGVPGKLAMGLLADRIPKKTALLATFGLVTLASLMVLRLDWPGFVVAFLVVHGFAVAAENVLLPLIVVECFGVLHMASIYGALMVVLLPGGALGPIFAGWIHDTLGSYEVAFTTFAALNVVSFVALAFVRREPE